MSKEKREMPIRSSGGGNPSSAASSSSIGQFADPVLKHLVAAHHKLPREKIFQDDFKITDEASFLSYMSSPAASALVPPKTRDLSYPLSSYYISSSHNTYLSGHQLYGEASTEAYTNVLQRGCRCLEIDVWDGEDSDTSSSEDEAGTRRIRRERSDSKRSRWDRMKTKAVNRMRSPSGSTPQRRPHSNSASSPLAALADNHQPTSAGLSPPSTVHLDPNSALPLPFKPEPKVLHGYTLTQSVTFRSVCEAIAESAFTATDLPLIVSLEVHANLSQQETMVEIMKEIWSQALVDITQTGESGADALPPLENLKNKILIKVKWTPNSHTGESNNPIEQVSSASGEAGSESAAAQKKASKVLKALSELGVYTRAYTFKHFSQPEASIPTHVFSLSEGKVHDMHGDPEHGPALFNHNVNYMMRVFPKGTRISSSNVDPTFHWRQGAQMVALNWQKLDKGMMLNEGMFAGQEGWVLKPSGYRAETTPEKGQKPDSRPIARTEKQTLDLDIQLLAAQNLPLPLERESSFLTKMKPYITCQLHVDVHGPPGKGATDSTRYQNQTETDAYSGEEDKEEKKLKRKSDTAKSSCPDFKGEMFTWSNVPDVVDELSFLRLKIKDNRSLGTDELIAWACIRLDRLANGLRFIRLLDAQGRPSEGALLVNVTKCLS